MYEPEIQDQAIAHVRELARQEDLPIVGEVLVAVIERDELGDDALMAICQQDSGWLHPLHHDLVGPLLDEVGDVLAQMEPR